VAQDKIMQTNQTVLVVAAHPDDEVLGCGGTIARHAAEGDAVHILIMAEGLTSRDKTRNVNARRDQLSVLAKTAQDVGVFLGGRSVELLSFPDNRMDTLPLLDVIKEVETRLEKIKPSIVYTHHHGDLNIDHQVTHRAVVTACRPYPEQKVKNLLFFDIPSSTDWQVSRTETAFSFNWFVDISGFDGKTTFLDKKLQALERYKDEMRHFPHARSIEAVRILALSRGAGVGIKAAESFVVGRRLI
jgi:N-acetylglucosamine malate deacetylase 1